MSTRKTPLEYVGAVSISAPAGKSPYYRLHWTEVNGLPDGTTAGRTLEGARWKAHGIAQRLERTASPFAMTSLLLLIEDYIATGRSPYSGASWKQGYRNQTEDQLMRCVKGFEHQSAMDVTRDLLNSMRAQAGTDRMVRQNTTALRGLLQWGYRHPAKYFTHTQAELLPEGCVNPIPTKATGRTMPKRKVRTRAVGQHEDYVQDADAPDSGQVVGFGDQLNLTFPAWGRLSVELAANMGFRWGEQFQLADPDVHLGGCNIQEVAHIHVDHQIESGAKAGDGSRAARVGPPKGYKTRLVAVPEFSFTGYPLLEALTARVAVVAEEKVAGTNPHGLLQPAKNGGMHWHSSFTNNYSHPAMEAAGWPTIAWNDGTIDRTVYRLTWHSLRHRFARNAVDIDDLKEDELMQAGGWENMATVTNRYYRSGKASQHSAAKKMARRKSPAV